MARQRRGGGFRTPEIKGTLGTLLRTTLQQASAVKDVIANAGRSQLDHIRTNRRRTEALAELGEIVLELVQRGEIDIDELPEAKGIVQELLDDEAGDGGAPERSVWGSRTSARAAFPEPHERPSVATSPSRSRFDARPEKHDGDTASASRWTLPKQGQPAASRVWRPDASTPVAPIATPPSTPKTGGITFDDDDLAEYMHPDDVPPKDSDA